MWHPPRSGGGSIRRDWNLTTEEYQSHDFPPELKPPHEFWYGPVRNPWDRVVSLWHWPPGHPAEDEISFRDFVLGGFRRPAQGDRFHITMASPASEWLRNANFVIRFEHREKDLARLASQLRRRVPVLHTGKTHDRRPYQEYYDDETRAAVAVWFAEDIQRFGYTF
jgi:hypothetical protein